MLSGVEPPDENGEPGTGIRLPSLLFRNTATVSLPGLTASTNSP